MQYNMIYMTPCPLRLRLLGTLGMIAAGVLPCATLASAQTPLYFPNSSVLIYTQPTWQQPAYRYVCNNPLKDCTGTVSVRITALPKIVAREEILTYTLYVRNDDSQTRTVDLRAYLDPNVTFENSTYGGYQSSTSVRWDALKIARQSSRTVVLRVRVRGDASGTEISLQAKVGSTVDTVTTKLSDTRYGTNGIRVNDDGSLSILSGNPPRYVPYYQIPRSTRVYNQRDNSFYRFNASNCQRGMNCR